MLKCSDKLYVIDHSYVFKKEILLLVLACTFYAMHRSQKYETVNYLLDIS